MNGKLSMLFGCRYLSSRKSLSVINIISRVSIFAVGIPVAAMVILLSVFNGFDGFVKDMYGSFDAELLIKPTKGKVFDESRIDRRVLDGNRDIDAYSFVLEENVMLEYRGRQAVGVLRGVDSGYEYVVPIRELIVGGEYELLFGDMQQTVVGQGLAYELGVRTNLLSPVNVYAPRRGNISSMLPIDIYNSGRVFPGGIFALDLETDGKYIMTTIEFARDVLNYEGRASAVMISLKEGIDERRVAHELRAELGEDFYIMTRYDQKSAMYQIMKYEKWGIFFIIFLVLVIASFSLVGSLVMLIIDKRADIRTVFTLGGDVRFVRRIFSNEGLLIGIIGTAGGVLLGVLFCWLQQTFGFIKIGAQTFLVDSYPVRMQTMDIVWVIVAALAVNRIITKFTVSKMIPKSSIRL